MNLIWPIIKKTAVLLWEELFWLCLFNLLTLPAILAGPVLVAFGWGRAPALLAAGLALLAAAPPALFGLFWLTHQIAAGKAIQFGAYFYGAGAMLKAAYIWGGVNLAVGAVLGFNIAFYRAVQAPWGGAVSLGFMGLAGVWLLLQLLALSLYPRLESPGFRPALRNALVLLGLRPAPVLLLGALAGGIIVTGLRVPLLLGLLGVSLAALLASVTTAEVVETLQGDNNGAANRP